MGSSSSSTSGRLISALASATRVFCPADNLPAYGWVKSVGRSSTGALTIDAHQVEPQFAELVAAGLVRKNTLVKVLGDGKLAVKVDVTANKFSGSAREAITAAGGSATEL